MFTRRIQDWRRTIMDSAGSGAFADQPRASPVALSHPSSAKYPCAHCTVVPDITLDLQEDHQEPTVAPTVPLQCYCFGSTMPKFTLSDGYNCLLIRHGTGRGIINTVVASAWENCECMTSAPASTSLHGVVINPSS